MQGRSTCWARVGARRGLACVFAALLVVMTPTVSWAADPDPSATTVAAATAPAAGGIVNPSADGSAPGALLVNKVLGWLKWAGMASALAGLLIGAVATGIGHFGSNYSASSAGRKWLLGGMGAAILSGLSWTIATTLYTATGSGK